MVVRRLILVALLALVFAGLGAAATASPVAAAVRWPLWTNWYHPTAEQDAWSDIAVGPGHKTYVCGTQGLTQGPGAKMVVARYRASSASPVWRVTWDGGSMFAQGYALAVDRKGDVVVCGSSSVPSRGYAVVKFSGKDGHVLWEHDLGDATHNWAVDVAVDKSSNVYATGNMHGGVLTGNAIVTMKFSAGGALVWQHSYKGPMLSSEVSALALDAKRNAYVTGATSTSDGLDWVTLRISPSGKQVWEQLWGGGAHLTDLSRRLVLSSKGALYVAGESQQTDVNDMDAVVIRYDRAGDVYWVKQFAQPSSADVVSEACLGSSGDLLLCGSQRPLDLTQAMKAWVCSVIPAGKTRWSKASAARSNPDGAMYYLDIVPGPGGSMYLAGSVEPDATDSDILVEKRSAKGALLWESVFGWPDGDYDQGGPLALDGASGLYVCGRVQSAADFVDAVLLKYKP